MYLFRLSARPLVLEIKKKNKRNMRQTATEFIDVSGSSSDLEQYCTITRLITGLSNEPQFIKIGALQVPQ